MCRRLRPKELEDLSALNALYRPGPLDGGMIDDFIDRHRGFKPTEYILPQMEEILGNTFGVLVYQEQIMQLAQKLAGYSLGQADLMRRAMGKPGRTYDIVLFGATGFTGGLTADYLAANAPADLKWAIAGRSQAKLEKVRERLSGINPALADMPLVIADSSDPTALAAMAESTSVVISTVGPYALYGEPLVKACAEAGTDYTDLTGEPGDG